MVASFEGQGRKLTLAEFFGLALVFNVSLPELLLNADAEWAFLAEGRDIRRDALVRLLKGCHPGKLSKGDLRGSDLHKARDAGRGEFLRWATIVDLVRGRGNETWEMLMEWEQAASQGRLEKYIAKRLATEPSVITLASLIKWGCSASEERDRRAEIRPDAKQHISRLLIRELHPMVAKNQDHWTISVEQLTGRRKGLLIEMQSGLKVLIEGKSSNRSRASEQTRDLPPKSQHRKASDEPET